MHQGYWGETKTLAVLERFSRFGLPLHMSETTLLSGNLMPPEIEDLNDYQVPEWKSTPEGEERQADEVVRALHDAPAAPVSPVRHLLGTDRQRVVAWGTGRPRAGRWHAQARIPCPPAAHQGRVVASQDDCRVR